MALTIGQKVVYPSQGPCLINAMVKRTVEDRIIMFYRLLVLDDGGGELFVPVSNVETIGIRPLIKKAEVPKLLGCLGKPGHATEDSKQRARDNSKLLASGSAFDLAGIVGSLSALNQTKSLSFREGKTLERAKRLLVCEISEVMGEARQDVEEQVDRALESGREERGLIDRQKRNYPVDGRVRGRHSRGRASSWSGN